MTFACLRSEVPQSLHRTVELKQARVIWRGSSGLPEPRVMELSDQFAATDQSKIQVVHRSAHLFMHGADITLHKPDVRAENARQLAAGENLSQF